MLQYYAIAVIAPDVDYSLPTLDFTFSSNTTSIVVPIQVMDADTNGERAEEIPLCFTINPASFTVQTVAPQCTRVVLLDDDSKSF